MTPSLGRKKRTKTTFVDEDSTKGPKGIDKLNHKINQLTQFVNSLRAKRTVKPKWSPRQKKSTFRSWSNVGKVARITSLREMSTQGFCNVQLFSSLVSQVLVITLQP